MRRFLLLFICWIAVTAAFGQYNSAKNRFEVDEKKGCAPFTVNVTDHGFCTGTCVLIPGDASPNQTINNGNFAPIVYSTPGTYKLNVVIQSNPDPIDEIEITVVENIQPEFQVYACTDNKVTIKVTDKSFDTYLVDFDGNGTTDTAIPMGNNATAQFDYSTLFPAPHTYSIGVRGKNLNAANNCSIRSESFTTLPTGAVLTPPKINTMLAVDGTTLSMGLTMADQTLNKLEISTNGSPTFQNYGDLYEKDSIGIPSLLVDVNYYCFQVSVVDPCAGTTLPGNIVCSQDFDVAYTNGVNELRWKTAGSLQSFSINRNTTNGYVTNYSPGATGYDDKDYDCNQQYCYQLVSHYSDGATSTSLIKCGIGILQTTYPAIENVVSVVLNGAQLGWKPDPTIKIDKFDVFKALPGNPLTPFATTKDTVYTDATYNYAGGTCYQINYSDACQNISERGIVACPVGLSGSINDANVVSLGWNSYKGYKQGVSGYEVIKYNNTTVVLGQFTTTDTTFIDNDPASENQIVQYRIRAISADPSIDDSWSNIIKIEKPARLIFPTAFTPNGDGINPTFTIAGKFVSKISLEIFDRWGALVFSSDKNEPWDGTKGGKPMPESAYIWKAEVEDFAGNSFTQQGTVILLRPRN